MRVVWERQKNGEENNEDIFSEEILSNSKMMNMETQLEQQKLRFSEKVFMLKSNSSVLNFDCKFSEVFTYCPKNLS